VRARLQASPLYTDGVHLPVTVSIGVATMLVDDKSVHTALSRADSALYRAKQRGRNRVEIA